MKARLYKGPFSGKVVECDGRNEIVITGPKRMSRKERYESERDWYSNGRYGFAPYKPPTVNALYRMCSKPVPNTISPMADDNSPIIYTGYAYSPLRHPDGSVFYEFVSKREY